MRKLAIIPMAGLLILAIAAPAAAGANVTNQSGSARVINGEWYGDDSWGYTYFALDSSYGSYGEFYEESGAWVECGDIDEKYGFVGTRTYGWAGDLEVVIDKRLDHGSASGQMELYTETVDDCLGIYGEGVGSISSFTVAVDGVGTVARFRNGGSYKLPGEYNGHSKESGKERQATGSIDLGDAGTREFGSAVLATITWTDHSNN
jgi:hypothetical protein